MTQHGDILRFDAERGFGFIGTPQGERNIFFHVRDFRGGTPAVGMAVRFERIEVGGKGPRAMQVQALAGAGGGPQAASAPAPTPRRAAPAPARPGRSNTHTQTAPRSTERHQAAPRPGGGPAHRGARGLDGHPALFGLAVLVWLGLLVAISLRRLWPVDAWVVLLGLAVLNGLTFFAYAADKSAAEQGRWRTPENSLHALALAGGWPAAWLAQRALRHKSRKQAFLAVYVLTVLLHLGALAAWWWRGGA